MRVVTIKHPPPALEGIPPDSSIGKMYDLPPQLAILMLAAGWVRNETRTLVRRHHDQDIQQSSYDPKDRDEVA